MGRVGHQNSNKKGETKMDIRQKVARARALAEFTGELLDAIFVIERLNAEIDVDTPDYEQARRRDQLEKAKIMGEVIEWLLK
jgi:hypothetical protein